MALLAQLYGSGREAERHVIEADATLRGHDDVPVDILVADLSTTGCLFVCAEPLALGDEITIGLTGLGRRQARVVRSLDRRYGCEFLDPLTDAEVIAASTMPGGTVVQFPAWPLHAPLAEDDLPLVAKLPGPIRLAITVGATVILWSGAYAILLLMR